ncbi:MAG: hypothetical protein LBB38_02290 [Puniceicoccales bacterium]|jgi:hypothetical protein|nr:hypothetical protein [Puniceicoccales bacterium]
MLFDPGSPSDAIWLATRAGSGSDSFDERVVSVVTKIGELKIVCGRIVAHGGVTAVGVPVPVRRDVQAYVADLFHPGAGQLILQTTEGETIFFSAFCSIGDPLKLATDKKRISRFHKACVNGFFYLIPSRSATRKRKSAYDKFVERKRLDGSATMKRAGDGSGMEAVDEEGAPIKRVRTVSAKAREIIASYWRGN